MIAAPYGIEGFGYVDSNALRYHMKFTSEIKSGMEWGNACIPECNEWFMEWSKFVELAERN